MRPGAVRNCAFIFAPLPISQFAAGWCAACTLIVLMRWNALAFARHQCRRRLIIAKPLPPIHTLSRN